MHSVQNQDGKTSCSLKEKRQDPVGWAARKTLPHFLDNSHETHARDSYDLLRPVKH